MYTKAEVKQVYALTPMQQSLLHHAVQDSDSAAYHEQLLMMFEGVLDLAAMNEAWQTVINRHDALRGRFLYEQVSRPVQVVPHVETLQIRQLPTPLLRDTALRLDRAQPFSPGNEHAMRLTTFCEPGGLTGLLWSFHHVLLDGWSIGLVLHEVLTLYRQLAEPGRAIDPLPPAPDYAVFQQWLAQQSVESARDWWREQLAGYPGEALLAEGLLKATGDEVGQSQELTVNLPAELSGQLTQLAQAHGAGLQHVLLAAWGLVAGAITRRNDLIIPTVVAGRPADIDAVEQLVGLFINTLPLRLRWQADTPFSQLLRAVRDHQFAALHQQHLPLAEALATCGSGIDHLFIMQYADQGQFAGPVTAELELAEVVFSEHTPYPLEVIATPGPLGLGLTFRSGGGVVAAHVLFGLADALCTVLGQVVQQAERPVGELAVVSPERQRTLRKRGRGKPWDKAPERALAGFIAQAQREPQRIALEQHGLSLSYGDLLAHANRLAHTLLARVPLQPGERVAVLCERSPDLLIGLLAVLQAGAAYVPVDPDFPPDRIAQMLEDSDCRLILGSEQTLRRLPASLAWKGQRIDQPLDDAPDTAPAIATTPDDLAYVIFTSGSTGRPKGVMLRQRNAAAFFGSLPAQLGLSAGQRLLAVTTISFDIAALELIGALWAGMTIVLASTSQARDPALLAGLLSSERIDCLQLTPTRLKLLLEHGGRECLAGLSTLLVGGEALTPALAGPLHTLPARVFNVYGPTETTIWSSFAELGRGPIHLGQAFAGEQLVLLTAEGEMQLEGAIGELAIGGVGVAAGYLNQPELTASRFIERPHIAKGPLYLTGDLAAWDADGHLRYLGRRDDQVKIRGVRIEPGEVEAILKRQPALRDAVVGTVERDDGERELVAWLVLADGSTAINPADWRQRLASQLPDALMPSHWLAVAELPQTPNGKLDRRALPAPVRPTGQLCSGRQPANATEAAIMKVYGEVLGRPVAVDDDFFAVGGHSLLAMQAIGRINRALKASYRLADLYQARSAQALAARPAGQRGDAAISPAADAADYPLSYQQESLWVLDQLVPGYAGYNVPGAYRFEPGLDPATLHRAWGQLVARHESLRTVFISVDDVPRQRVLADMPFVIDRIATDGRDDMALQALVGDLTRQPFDLMHGPLFRLALIEPPTVNGQRPWSILVLVTHHIISDGWSDNLMVQDLAAAYRDQPLPPAPPLRYRDYAVWQRQQLAGWQQAGHAGFWREHLADLPLLSLPLDGLRLARPQRDGARHNWQCPPDSQTAWRTLPSSERFAAAIASVAAVLHLASGQTDVVIGTPLSGRDRPELQDQVGLFLNLLPLRLQLTPDMSLASLQAAARSEIDSVLPHAEFPFARLVDSLGLNAPPGRHPVFDVMLILHQQAMPVPDLAGSQGRPWAEQSWSSRFDLDFELWTGPEGLHGFIEYDSSLFQPSSAHRYAEHWQAVLLALATEPDTTLAELAHRLPGARQPVQDTEAFVAASLALDDEF